MPESIKRMGIICGDDIRRCAPNPNPERGGANKFGCLEKKL